MSYFTDPTDCSLSMPEKCECNNASPSKICKKPFYDAFDACLICSHDRACHRDEEEE